MLEVARVASSARQEGPVHDYACPRGWDRSPHQLLQGHAPILLGAMWKDQYTNQVLHVWVVPYPGGVFSDDLAAAAMTAAARAPLAETKPGHLAP